MYWKQVSINDKTFDIEPLYYHLLADNYNCRLLLLFRSAKTHLFLLNPDDSLAQTVSPLPFKVLDALFHPENE